MFLLALVLTACSTDCEPLHYDWDGDGYGDEAIPNAECEAGPGWVAEVDCDDARADVFPGADETCDGADQDCDGTVDEDPVDGATWFGDGDGDGLGDDADTVVSCAEVEGYVSEGGDCGPDDPDRHPLAEEVCNDEDDDCDGVVDDDAQGPNYTFETAAQVLGDDGEVTVRGTFGDGEDTDHLLVATSDDFDNNFSDDYYFLARLTALDPDVHVTLTLYRSAAVFGEIEDARVDDGFYFEGTIFEPDSSDWVLRVTRTSGGDCDSGYTLHLANGG